MKKTERLATGALVGGLALLVGSSSSLRNCLIGSVLGCLDSAMGFSVKAREKIADINERRSRVYGEGEASRLFDEIYQGVKDLDEEEFWQRVGENKDVVPSEENVAVQKVRDRVDKGKSRRVYNWAMGVRDENLKLDVLKEVVLLGNYKVVNELSWTAYGVSRSHFRSGQGQWEDMGGNSNEDRKEMEIQMDAYKQYYVFLMEEDALRVAACIAETWEKTNIFKRYQELKKNIGMQEDTERIIMEESQKRGEPPKPVIMEVPRYEIQN
jgi:hypothetical protein